MAGKYALKNHLDFPTLTFILSCLHWEYTVLLRIEFQQFPHYN